jgi:glycerate dehydrogenase
MEKPKVYVTRKLPEKALDMIEKECNMEINTHDRAMTRGELEIAIQGKDGLLCLLTDEINEKLLELNPNLKIIANYAVGYNNIDIEACSENKIPVSNTPGVLTETTADLAWTLLMATARRVVEADNFTREGKYEGWSPMLFMGGDIYNKTLGIIGFGSIGQRTAELALAFGMNVITYDRSPTKKIENPNIETDAVDFLNLNQLYAQSDVISLQCPLTEETSGLINQQSIARMKDGVIIVNTARGGLIVEEDLAAALKSGKIQTAALDVLTSEPPAASNVILNSENTIITPHIAWATKESRQCLMDIVYENIKGYIGGNIINQVN